MLNSRTLALFMFVPMVLSAQGIENVRHDLKAMLDTLPGTYAVAFEDLGTRTQILINEKEMYHAASTMKTPVMIEVYDQKCKGKLSLDTNVEIKNEFRSLVDGSIYQLDLSDDSDDSMYKRIGQRATVRELVFQMITVSSNLATNLLMDLVGPENVTRSMRDLGAMDIEVLRVVEDGKAFERGINNRTNALDLLVIFDAIARSQAVDSSSSVEMMEVLLQQKFRDIIPAMLPSDVRVAHKTGSITGVEHDSGIVLLPDGRRYVLVLLSKGLKDAASGKRALSMVSKRIYDFMTEGK